MTAEKIDNGMLVTLSGYTHDAAHFARNHEIQFVAEDDLLSMVTSGGLTRDPELLRALNDTRKLCPKCESEMILRTSRKGSDAGRQFWGCFAFPRCRFTLPAT